MGSKIGIEVFMTKRPNHRLRLLILSGGIILLLSCTGWDHKVELVVTSQTKQGSVSYINLEGDGEKVSCPAPLEGSLPKIGQRFIVVFHHYPCPGYFVDCSTLKTI